MLPLVKSSLELFGAIPEASIAFEGLDGPSGLPVNDLHGFVEALPRHRRPEDVVAVHRGLDHRRELSSAARLSKAMRLGRRRYPRPGHQVMKRMPCCRGARG